MAAPTANREYGAWALARTASAASNSSRVASSTRGTLLAGPGTMCADGRLVRPPPARQPRPPRELSVPRLFASGDDQDLVNAERDVRAVFSDLDLDLRSLAAVSNIFRAATAVRNHMENGVLAEHDLSWSAFTAL